MKIIGSGPDLEGSADTLYVTDQQHKMDPTAAPWKKGATSHNDHMDIDTVPEEAAPPQYSARDMVAARWDDGMGADSGPRVD